MTFPEWVEPMAATLTQERFTGPEWLFERKVDGIRLLAFRNGSDVRLLSRNQLPQHCPPVAQQVAALQVTNVILDGELTWSGTGFDAKLLLALRARLGALETTSPPFTRGCSVCASEAQPRTADPGAPEGRPGGRVLVDTGRNGWSATFGPVYTVRARPGASVASSQSLREPLERLRRM